VTKKEKGKQKDFVQSQRKGSEKRGERNFLPTVKNSCVARATSFGAKEEGGKKGPSVRGKRRALPSEKHIESVGGPILRQRRG